MLSRSIRTYRKELKLLYKELNELQEKRDKCEGDSERQEAQQRVDAQITMIDELIEGPFARAVFDHYSKKKPCLVDNYTNEIVEWDSVFGCDFNKISNSRRHSLVGLIDGDGGYRIK